MKLKITKLFLGVGALMAMGTLCATAQSTLTIQGNVSGSNLTATGDNNVFTWNNVTIADNLGGNGGFSFSGTTNYQAYTNPLYATFVSPASNTNASYSNDDYTLTWSSNSNNLMTIFQFANGELANYSTLTIKFSDLTGNARAGYYTTDNPNSMTAFTYNGGTYFGSAGTKEIDLAAQDVDLSKVTRIVFGGNNNSGNTGKCTIKASDVYLTPEAYLSLKPGLLYCTSITAHSTNNNASYNTQNNTYTWTGKSANLVDLFSFGEGGLADYTNLYLTISDLTEGQTLRVGYYTTTFNQVGTITANGSYRFSLASISDKTSVTSISFGAANIDANSTNGSCVINPANVYLAKAFGTLANGSAATYNGSTFSWTSSSNNLMTVYSFSNGELVNYDQLSVTINNLTGDGAKVRVLYNNGSQNVAIKEGISTNGTYLIDLSGISDKSAVTSISFAGNSASGSCTVTASDFVLSSANYDNVVKEVTTPANCSYPAGNYDITVNLNDMTISIEEAEEQESSITVSVGADDTEQSGEVNGTNITMQSLNDKVLVFITVAGGGVPYYKVEVTGDASTVNGDDYENSEKDKEEGMGGGPSYVRAAAADEYTEAQKYENEDSENNGQYYVVLTTGKKGTLSIATDPEGSDAVEYNWEVINTMPTGVSVVKVAADEEAYYTLQGVKVANPDHGIFIRVKNGKVEKVIL